MASVNTFSSGSFRRCLLVAAISAACCPVQQVWADNVDSAPAPASAPAAEAPAQAESLYELRMTAKPLPQAIAELSSLTGLQVLYAGQEAFQYQAPALNGRYTLQQALRQLVAGSGLLVRFTGEKSAVIEPPHEENSAVALPVLKVNSAAEHAGGPVAGYVATRSNTATKTDTAIIETPQSISVVSRDQMDSQGAQTVSEALRYTTGILVGSGGGQTRFDTTIQRGFGGMSNSSNFTKYVDGMSWPHITRSAVQMDAYALERVEAFRGPSSLLYGQADPGGFVNQVSKRPTDEPVHEVMAVLGNHDYKTLGVDLSDALDQEGKLSYRLTGLVRDAETGVDFQKDERQMLQASLRWQPTDSTRVTPYLFYQHDPNQPDASFVPPQLAEGVMDNGLTKLPVNYFQGDPNWNLFKRTMMAAGYEFSHDISDVWQFRQHFRFGTFESDTRQLNNGAFDAAIYPALTRTASSHYAETDALNLDNQLQANFTTGNIAHTFLAGVDWRKSSSDLSFGTGVAPQRDDVYHPDYGLAITEPVIFRTIEETLDQVGLYLQEQLRWKRVVVTGGLRWDDFKSTSDMVNFGTPSSTRASDSALTGRLGAVYLFDNGWAPYISYSSSFEPVLGADAYGDAFDPTEGEQMEAGLRWQSADELTMVTLSAYDLTKKNITTTDPSNPANTIQTGEVQSSGFELEAKVQIVSGLNVLASYANNDTEITSSNIAGEEGNRPMVVPEEISSLWMDYNWQHFGLPQLTVGAGVRRVGSSYADNTGSLRIPGYTLMDAMVRYQFSEAWQLTVNAKNLTDEHYIAACGYGTCWQGVDRTVQATVRFRW